ncbi:hypothetical protein MVEN_00321500 [Mycena venus]|uniref:F-box domain-containing protein n=1 Tax=Mycena venus TaxID=2733690 RepID=A0A8H7D7R6_9AGAR|nr:hypothetical protein MVEN_00321500 [Mycena venus]
MSSSQPTRLAADLRVGVKTLATGNTIHRVLPTKSNPTNNPSVPPDATTKVESPRKSKHGAASKIPPEIGLEIFSWILLDACPGSLAPFCRVSRHYQARAQHLLYRAVDLRDCDLQRVLSWCLAVTRHEHLAHRVHSLWLSLPVLLKATDAAKMCGALNRCVNLSELQMLHQPTKYDRDKEHFDIRNQYAECPRATEREEESLVPALGQFTMIESFVLQVRCSRAMHFKAVSGTNAFDMGSSADLENFGVEVMSRCPTLRRVEIGAEVPQGCERTCILKVGDASVEILCTHYQELKWDATGDFYNSVNDARLECVH